MRKADFKEKEIDNHLRIIAKTSFFVFILMVLSKILGYVYRILIAKYFGPESYGIFTISLILFSFIASVASFQLGNGLLRYIPLLRAKNKTREINSLLGYTLRILIISGLVFTILLIAFSKDISILIFHEPKLTDSLRIIGFFIIFALLSDFFLGILRGYEKIYSFSFIFNIVLNVARIIILILFIIIDEGKNTNLIVISYATGFIFSMTSAYIVIKKKIKTISFKEEIKCEELKKQLISYSWPLILYGIISLIFYWIDSLSLGFYKSSFAVGLYNAAVPIATLLLIIPEIFMQLFQPMINKEYSKGNKEVIKQISKQVTKWIFIISFPIFILIFLFPGAAINFLFGPQYLPAENSLRVLLVGTFILTLFSVCTNLISMRGKSKLLLVDISLASGLNIILNSLLIPMPKILWLENSNGLNGAAFATMISIIFLNSLFLIQIKKDLGFFPLRRKIIRIVLISIIPIVILFYLKEIIEINTISVVILSAFFFLTYLFLMIISGSFDKNDCIIIKSVMKKIREFNHKTN